MMMTMTMILPLLLVSSQGFSTCANTTEDRFALALRDLLAQFPQPRREGYGRYTSNFVAKCQKRCARTNQYLVAAALAMKTTTGHGDESNHQAHTQQKTRIEKQSLHATHAPTQRQINHFLSDTTHHPPGVVLCVSCQNFREPIFHLKNCDDISILLGLLFFLCYSVCYFALETWLCLVVVWSSLDCSWFAVCSRPNKQFSEEHILLFFIFFSFWYETDWFLVIFFIISYFSIMDGAVEFEILFDDYERKGNRSIRCSLLL